VRRLVVLVGFALSLLGAPTAQAASAETWYWTETTMLVAIHQDYGYDPGAADPNDPWHYELKTVECHGYGRFIANRGERYFRRFVCTLTYVATDPSVANYVDVEGARVTGRYDHQEYEPPADAGPAVPDDRTQNVLIGYRSWSPVDDDGSPSWLIRPRNLLLLGPLGALADSPRISRIKWGSWGGARARGVGRYRTKIYEPWSRVRLVAHHLRTCGATQTYTRVTATFRYESLGRTRTSTRTWPMQPCGVRLR
jgi:hypothetical protein